MDEQSERQLLTDVRLILTEVAEIRTDNKSIKSRINKHEEILNGNGHEGLVIRVDRLMQSEVSRVWHIRAIWVAIIGGVGKYFLGWVNK